MYALTPAQLDTTGATAEDHYVVQGGLLVPKPPTYDVLVDAKGDLLIGTGPDLRARLPIGADGQVLTVDGSLPAGMKWATPAAGTGGGGGAAPGLRYYATPTDNPAVSPMPTADTLIPGLTLTVPAAAVDRTAFVSWFVAYAGAHSNRVNIYLNGVATGPNVHPVKGGGDGVYQGTVPLWPVTLLAGSTTHTIAVMWNAEDSTAGVSMGRRWLVADVYAATGSGIAV